MAGIVQSVIFDSKKWSVLDSAKWLLDNEYKVKKIDQPDNFIRFRQISPVTLKNKGYTTYRNKKLGKSRIELVIAYKDSSRFATL